MQPGQSLNVTASACDDSDHLADMGTPPQEGVAHSDEYSHFDYQAYCQSRPEGLEDPRASTATTSRIRGGGADQNVVLTKLDSHLCGQGVEQTDESEADAIYETLSLLASRR